MKSLATVWKNFFESNKTLLLGEKKDIFLNKENLYFAQGRKKNIYLNQIKCFLNKKISLYIPKHIFISI